MKSMKKRVVILDFDGVIVDSIDFAYEINRRHNPEMTKAQWVNFHLGDSFYDGYNDSAVKRLSPKDFYDEYVKYVYQKSPVAGMAEVIQELRDRFTLVVVSGSPAEIINQYLGLYNLSVYFDHVFGKEFHDNKREKFEHILTLERVSAEDCIQITDTVCDLREGNKVGIGSIGVTWGVFDRDKLLVEDPFVVLDKPIEIPESINRYFHLGL